MTPLIGRTEVQAAVIDHIKLWIVAYIARVEREEGRDPRYYATPRAYTVANEWRLFPGDQLPLVIVTCPGTAGQPTVEEDGSYTTPYEVAVGAVVTAPDEANATQMSGAYGKALRALMIEQSDLGGFASGVEWRSEQFDEYLADTDSRTQATVGELFTVEVPSTVNRFDGPLEPPDDPYAIPGDLSEIDSTHVEVDRA